MFDKTLYEQFKTNKQERLGILSLIGCVLALIITANFFLNPKAKRLPLSSELKQVVDKYYKDQPTETQYENEEVKPKKKTDKNRIKHKTETLAQLFYFDPNTIDKQSYIRLGFPPYQSSTIINFRNSGYTFKQPEDLLRVYNIDTVLVLKLAPYMLFENLEKANKTTDSSNYDTQKTELAKPQYIPKVIEVNSATHEELISIYGIGNVFADIIIKRRDRLGGYFNHSQISEAFTFSDSTLRIFERSLTIDTTLVKKININKVTFKELLAHQYITYEQNQIIYPFIESRRPINDLNILNDVMLIDSITINKLKPYLATQ